MLPQVLAGLGLVSLINAGCLLWLQRLGPLFFAIAIGALGYQVWVVRRSPSSIRQWRMKMILGVSLFLNVGVILSWVVLSIRYR